MTSSLLYLVTGEPSGDYLAARLMRALREAQGGIRFAGIGGEEMRELGLRSLFPQDELAVMGWLEVLPRYLRLRRRLEQTLADIARLRPDAVVTVDSWGFSGRLARRLKASDPTLPRIQYVAPMVWAWKKERVHDVAAAVDLLLCLWPHEPAYFQEAHLEAVHVGHAVAECGADAGDGRRFRAHHQIPPGRRLLCLLPGSRRSETSRLLPVFSRTLHRLTATHPDLGVVVPTVDALAGDVRRALADCPLPVTVVEGPRERYDAMAACEVALAASGSVALELAMARVPMVITYRMAPLSAFYLRRMWTIKYVCPINLLADAGIVPELLQEACRPDLLAAAVAGLLDDETERSRQVAAASAALRRLNDTAGGPSRRAAEEVLRVIAERRTHP